MTVAGIDQISSSIARSTLPPCAFCGVAARTSQRDPSGIVALCRPYDQPIFAPNLASRIGASNRNTADARSSLCAADSTVCGSPRLVASTVSHQPMSAENARVLPCCLPVLTHDSRCTRSPLASWASCPDNACTCQSIKPSIPRWSTAH